MATKLAKKCSKCGREFDQKALFCPFDGHGLMFTTPPSGAHTGLVLDRRYRLVELIGRGGMGTVYKAIHLDLNRAVAVKVLNGELINDHVAIQRFRREAKALGRITHPNAVNVSDFGVTPEGLAYIVMEYLQGQNLRSVISKESPLALSRVARIIRHVSAAVGAAHVEEVIHRDLKPDNVVLIGRGPDETAKVLDFGIAKLRTTGGLVNTLTESDAVVGTPQYMSPEACQGHVLLPTTDVYALGIIAYELLVGKVPFDSGSSIEVALQQVNAHPPRMTSLREEVSEEIEAVVFRALSKDPQLRQPRAEEFGEQMDAAIRAAIQIRSRITTPMMRPTSWDDVLVVEEAGFVPEPPKPQSLLPLSTLAIAGLAALGLLLGLLVAVAAVYFFVPPPTQKPADAIERPASGASTQEGQPSAPAGDSH